MVTGNDKDTLMKLIEEKNKNREEGIAEVISDEKMNWFLKRQLSFDGRIELTNADLVKPWKLSRNNEQKIIQTYIPKK